MGWTALIAALIQVLGPLVADWLQKCAEKRATQATERLPAFESFPDEHAARDALFDELIAGLPKRAYGRRTLARRAKAIAAKHGITSQGATVPIGEEDRAEIADLAVIAGEEE